MWQIEDKRRMGFAIKGKVDFPFSTWGFCSQLFSLFPLIGGAFLSFFILFGVCGAVFNSTVYSDQTKHLLNLFLTPNKVNSTDPLIHVQQPHLSEDCMLMNINWWDFLGCFTQICTCFLSLGFLFACLFY